MRSQLQCNIETYNPRSAYMSPRLSARLWEVSEFLVGA